MNKTPLWEALEETGSVLAVVSLVVTAAALLAQKLSL